MATDYPIKSPQKEIEEINKVMPEVLKEFEDKRKQIKL